MSYNIDTCKVLVLDARMRAADVIRCRKLLDEETGGMRPDSTFLDAIEREAIAACVDGDADKLIRLQNFDWRGDCSGYSFDNLKEIAKYIHGRVDVIFTWEGGDSVSGLRIVDGVVQDCDVVQTLVPKQEKANG